MILNPNTHANTGTLFKSFVLLFVLFLQVGSLFSQNINVDAPPSVEVNVTRVSLNFMSEAAGTSITWSIPDAQIMYESPNKSTVEVVFNTVGTKIIQAWGYSFSTGNVYGIVSVEVLGTQAVFVSGQVRQWGGGALANRWVDATEIGGSGSRSAQTFYDGTYNFYVPKGTSWQVIPRGNTPCVSFNYYPQTISNIQQTAVLDFFRFNYVYEVKVNPFSYEIKILGGSGYTARYWYAIQYTDGEIDYNPLAERTSVFQPNSPKQICCIDVWFADLGCGYYSIATN